MAITAKSLHHANVVVVFRDKHFVSPDIGPFTALYRGEEAKGARFLEDPILQTKMLVLPAIQEKVTLEGTRLRVDDDSGKEPENSRIIKDILRIREELFPDNRITGYGFNYDMVYRFNNVIPIRRIFDNFFGATVLRGRELRDFGFQFTLEAKKAEVVDTFFMKIVSPLELAVHLNRHYAKSVLPEEKILVDLLSDCYTTYVDEVITSFEEDIRLN